MENWYNWRKVRTVFYFSEFLLLSSVVLALYEENKISNPLRKHTVLQW